MVRSVSSAGEVILIAPPGVAASLLKRSLVDIQYFMSLEAFETWRASGGAQRGDAPIGERADQALRELGIDPARLSIGLKLSIEWLRSQDTVPQLKSFAIAVSSRRAFFSSWAGVTQIRPREFLEHLRGLYAEDLLLSGAKLREVMQRTGCVSPAGLQRCLEQRSHFRA
jgi:hypothetical protein